MRKTKQIAALMMAAAMALTACSCGAQTAQSSQAGGTETEAASGAEQTRPAARKAAALSLPPQESPLRWEFPI